MTPAALTGYVMVPMFGALMCTAPAITRPTLQFGVRVPPACTGAAVIRRERRAYYWRSAAVAACCVATAVILRGAGSWWLPRLILLLELAADVSCFQLARRKISAVKTAEGWFAGLRQTVVADTSWRTEPQRFPVRWLIPAIGVIAATIVIGVIRYPHLGSELAALGGRRVARSPARAFALVVAQLYVTGLWAGLLLLIYRSRPDIDVADPTGSLRRYRRFLGRFTRAALIVLALLDLTFLLAALQLWQLYQLHGSSAALPLGPALAGPFILIAIAAAAGRDRARPAGRVQPLRRTAAAGRDDDRFWKAGLLYVNRTDPSIMVTARFAIGWTINFGNPAAWLIITVITATVAGLALIRLAVGF